MQSTPGQLIAANMLATTAIFAFVFSAGTVSSQVDLTDFMIELISAFVAFTIFVVASWTQFRPLLKTLLLTGLVCYQFGRSFDAVDEIVAFNWAGWAALGDSLTLLGEVLVAYIAIRWVLSTTVRANTDPLTGLYNRRYHERELKTLVKGLNSETQPFAILALDLDNFKLINDQHGHAAGDAALVHAAQLLAQCSRNHDVISRVGGEEFEVILKNIDEQGAAMVAERMRARLEKSPPENMKILTASIGVASHYPGESIASLRSRADAAVYISKHAGKNRITIAVGPNGEPAVDPICPPAKKD